MISFDMFQWYKFEFIVMCIGKYGDIPNMPKFPPGKGAEIFRGKVMHSLDYCKLDEDATKELMKGKKVVVIGYKKSSIDLAVECAEANRGNFLNVSLHCVSLFEQFPARFHESMNTTNS